MPEWSTFVKIPQWKFFDARTFLQTLNMSLHVLRIPPLGTHWSAQRNQLGTHVFAKWNVEDEIRAGYYD
jgi:hypothetical protein